MHASVFMLEDDQKFYKDIKRYLEDNIFRDIVVQLVTISNDPKNLYRNDSPDYIITSEEEYGIMKNIGNFMNYMKLLKSSMINIRDFSIGLFNDKGQWGYVGYEDDRYFLRLTQPSLRKIFPAVSIMDRMIMVPSEIHDAFEKDMDLLWFLRPLDLQGVLLTDFQDLKAILESTKKASNQIKSEIAGLCRRHMLVRKIRKPDFNELSGLLNVDINFLQLYKDEIFLPTFKITPKIISNEAKLEISSKVMIEIKDESEQKIEHVLVKVRVPGQTLTLQTLNQSFFAESIYLSDETGRTKIIEFEVTPHTIPYCPIEVIFEIQEGNQAHAPFPIALFLDVSA